MSLWSRFRSFHLGWQITIGAVLISFWPLLLIALPVFAYYGLKEKPRAYRLAGVMVALLPVVVFVGVMAGKNGNADDIRRQLDELDSQQHGTELLVQKTAPSGDARPPASAPAAEQAKAETAYDRIVSIVETYGEFPTITNLNNINARNPEPPYEVIVVMSHVKSCFSAKEKAQHIMRDLYHDPVAGPTLLRVKAINNEYVSASLGRDGAKIMHESFWTGGPTNFFKALQSASDYDMDDVQEATSRTATSYTYAELEPDCQ
jgi:hypothetical protein